MRKYIKHIIGILVIINYLSPKQLFAQLLINEIQLNNKGIILDQDLEAPSWVELYNAGNFPINLKNYYLSDDSTNRTRWKFPSYVLASHQRALIFLSGKDTFEKIDHWETVIQANTKWDYVTSDTIWTNINHLASTYDASAWAKGNGGIGLADGDDSTVIAATSRYTMRKVFKLKNKTLTNLKKCFLMMDNENRCYVYINASGMATFNKNTTTHIRNGNQPIAAQLDLDILKYYLTYSDSQVLTLWFTGATDSLHQTAIPYLCLAYSDTVTHVYNPVKNPWLKNNVNYLHSNFKLKPNESICLFNNIGQLIDYKKITESDYNISLARIPDGGNWCVTNMPTPDSINDGSKCYAGFLEPPIFLRNSGLIKLGDSIKLYTPQPDCIIRYTTNGNKPDSNSKIYKNGIKITKDMVITATCYDTTYNFFNSKSRTNTYITNNKTFKLPIISIVSDSLELFDPIKGLYTSSGYIGGEKRRTHIEYMLANGKVQFELDADLSIHGNGSRGYNKKSLRVETNNSYDSSFINYKLFPRRSYTDIYSFNLRSGSQDQAGSFIRDELTNRMMLNTNLDVMEHQSCAVFLNGEFWGIYHIREKQDNELLENISGVDKDSIDLIGIFGVHNGTADYYYKLLQLYYTDSLNNSGPYDSLNKYLDIKNFTDYITIESFANNADWPGNNTKLWRPRRSNGKFRYLLYDTDYSTNDYNYDKIGQLIQNNFFGLGKLYKNTKFKNYFVNRYADLMNTELSIKSYKANIANIKSNLIYDMPKEIVRWNNFGTLADWEFAVSYIDTFVKYRTITARNDLKNNFNLTKQVDLTISIFPIGAGVVKLNTIIPTVYPWKGVYFDGVPVTITAIPNPGFRFDSITVNAATSLNKTVTQNLTNANSIAAIYFNGTAVPLKISVSEFNYKNNLKINSGNWIEIHNYDSIDYDLTGYKMKTSKSYAVYEFKDNFIFRKNSYWVLCEDTTLFKKIYPGVKNIIGNIGTSLNNSSDSIVLVGNNGRNKISILYTDSIPWPECADGTGRTVELKNDSLPANAGKNWFNGCIGGSPGKAYTACNEVIVISEINYNSKSNHDAGDWVELYNNSNNPVSLSNWHFQDGDPQHDYILPKSYILPARGRVVLASNLVKFASEYPLVSNVLGPLGFSLDNEGEHLMLFDNYWFPQFSMIYHNDSFGWAAGPNGRGYTLELNKQVEDYSNPKNWERGCLYGSPGEAKSICDEDVKLVATEINYRSLTLASSEDWIEFLNTSKDTINTNNWTLNTSRSTATLPSINILPNEYVILSDDTTKFKQWNAPPSNSKLIQINLNLEDSGDIIKLLNNIGVKTFEMNYSATLPWDSLANGHGYTLQLHSIQGSIGAYSLPQNWLHGCFEGNPFEFTHQCENSLIIDEINFNSDSLTNISDWVELYNKGNKPMNLYGYTLKSQNNIYQWNINKLVMPAQRLLLANDTGKIRTLFGLPAFTLSKQIAQNDTIRISNIDQLNVATACFNASSYFLANGLGKTLENYQDTANVITPAQWKEACFYGSPGTADNACAPINLCITEINHSPNSAFNTGRWFELRNLDTVNSISLDKYSIALGAIQNRYEFDSSLTIKPKQSAILSSDSSKLRFFFPWLEHIYAYPETIFKGNLIRIWDQQKKPIFCMQFQPSWGGLDNGKTLNLTHAIADIDYYSASGSWTEECLGGSPMGEIGWCDTTIIVSEINYQADATKDAGDWVEIYNPSSSSINLEGYKVLDADNHIHTLRRDTILPLSFKVITSDSIKFINIYSGIGTKIISSSLNHPSEGSIRIYKPNKQLVYYNEWQSKFPWNDSADGRGYTLEYKNDQNSYSSPRHWFIGCKYGSPGTAYQTNCTDDTASTGFNLTHIRTQINLFPNPFNGILHINTGDLANNIFRIYDISGTNLISCLQSGTKETDLDLSMLASGIYILEVRSEKVNQSFKLIKY